jgi:hypothetical protein
VRAVWTLLLLGGCWLERVTGEAVPLDPRFYEAVEKAQGDPGVGGGSAIPFAAVDGPKVTVRGVLASTSTGAIDIDVRTPDPSQPGGVKGHGKLLVDGPGPFTLEVPAGLGPLELQAFQDLDSDGPGGADPFGQTVLTIADSEVDAGTLTLLAGARGTGSSGPVHQEMPAGAPGGAPMGNGGGGSVLPSGPDPFASFEGPRIEVSGTLTFAGPGVIDLDLFQPDAASTGGRRMLGKLKRPAGAYSLSVPANFGPLIMEAFVDEKGDGPSLSDPSGTTRPSPLPIAAEDIVAVDITLTQRTPEPPPAPPPPPDAPASKPEPAPPPR